MAFLNYIDGAKEHTANVKRNNTLRFAVFNTVERDFYDQYFGGCEYGVSILWQRFRIWDI